MTETSKKKQIILAVLLTAASISAFAQGNGMAGITEATNLVTSYFDPATKLIYAIGAVVGLIGGIKVYGKFSSGDPGNHPALVLPVNRRFPYIIKIKGQWLNTR